MAGGEGAKERRRLKRLQATGGEAKAKPHAKKPGSENQRQNKQQHGKQPTRKPLSKASKFDKPNLDDKKKNKVKKPKHLKRKLEQAAETDEQTKEQLQKELEDWERRKEIFSQQPKRLRGGQEASRAPTKTLPAESVTPKMEDTTLSVDPPASFPRNAAPPKKQDPPGSKANEDEDDEDAEDSSSDESSVEAPPAKEAELPEAKAAAQPVKAVTKPDPSSDESDSSSDSDSDEDEEEPTARRQRGKRRRGRKDTAKKIEETKEVEGAKAVASPADESGNNNDAADDSATKKRYCLGRKPVTDFTLGQTYAGKVVYVKPFGVFLDIGCHSDAFCHVSRISDDYVESPDKLFKEGDAVEKVRIVEIDRRRKRITVSLQTEARIEDERASVEARKQRKESRASKKKISTPSKQPKPANRSHAASHEEKQSTKSKPFPVEKETPHYQPMEEKDPSQMTPAELKRARKLARRAARREQTGDDDDVPEKQ